MNQVEMLTAEFRLPEKSWYERGREVKQAPYGIGWEQAAQALQAGMLRQDNGPETSNGDVVLDFGATFQATLAPTPEPLEFIGIGCPDFYLVSVGEKTPGDFLEILF